MQKKDPSFYHYRRFSGNPAVIVDQPRHSDLRMHAHDFIEMVIVNGGRGLHQLDNQEYPLAAGDVFIIPRGVRHGYRNVQNFRITNMLFKLGTVERHFPEIAELPGFLHFFRAGAGKLLNLDSAELAAIEKLQLSITVEQAKKQPGSNSMCLACLAEILIYLCRLQEKRTPQVALPPHREFAEVCFHIGTHSGEAIRVGELAALARMSVRTFQRHFSRATGLAPLEYVRKTRLEKAREHLRNGNRSIAEIAMECGFPSSSALSTEFRKQYNLTPRAFRDDRD